VIPARAANSGLRHSRPAVAARCALLARESLDRECEAEADGCDDGDADEARQNCGQPLVLDAREYVVGDDLVGRILGVLDELFVLGDTLETVGMRGRPRAELAPTAPFEAGAWPSIRSGRADVTSATAAAVIRPSPMPMRAWTPSIAGRATSSGDVPERASCTAVNAAAAMTVIQPALNAPPIRKAGLPRPAAATAVNTA
jgi:hypothetical protein